MVACPKEEFHTAVDWCLHFRSGATIAAAVATAKKLEEESIQCRKVELITVIVFTIVVVVVTINRNLVVC